MKRIGRLLGLVAIVVVLAVNISFAGSLTLVDSFPQEGKSNLNPQNVVVKLIFSEKISDDATASLNKNSFAIIDEEGKAIDFEPLYNEDKYPNEVWLLINTVLEQNAKYEVTVLEGLQSSSGNTLSRDFVLNFGTRDMEKDSKGYMMLMLLMIAGMMVFTVIDTKRKAKKEAAKRGGEEKVNPYKEARRTGKSVEDIVARTEKEKQQAERRRQRLERKQAEGKTDKKERPTRPGVKAVGAKRSYNELGYETPEVLINNRLAREKAKAKKHVKKKVKSKGSKQRQRKRK